MRKHCSDFCKLRPCLNKESKNSARMRTIVTAALQRQYSQTELIFWISLVCCAFHWLYPVLHNVDTSGCHIWQSKNVRSCLRSAKSEIRRTRKCEYGEPVWFNEETESVRLLRKCWMACGWEPSPVDVQFWWMWTDIADTCTSLRRMLLKVWCCYEPYRHHWTLRTTKGFDITLSGTCKKAKQSHYRPDRPWGSQT